VKGRLRVGTSGYQYRHWRGVFYPERLRATDWLAYYAARFDSLELNATFYQLPPARRFDAWRRQVPEGFLFALKFSRYGSHLKHLRAPRGTLGRFVPRARHLGAALGPVLVQLSPRWDADPGRLDAFLAAAPRDLRWAVEFRDARWLCDPVLRVLAAHGAALCIHDLLPGHPRELTADWTYLRFHGGRARGGGYTPQALGAAAARIRRWLARGCDVHAYFNNDAGGHAPADAAALRRYVAGPGERSAATGRPVGHATPVPARPQ
jgi:uncharacterized protein YecE (DUF72 family)